MEHGRKKIMSIIVLAGLVVVLILVNGCKKSEPTTDETTTITSQEIAQPDTRTGTIAKVVATVEQTICPIMGEPIDKNIYVEILGKKVYFCCEGCEQKFMEEPEKYLDKLPQFQK